MRLSTLSAALAAAYVAIDAANADDPNLVDVDGTSWPRAQFQGVRATYWLDRLDPRASDAVALAARAHHLRRWAIARSAYPEGRAGYLRWRRDLKVAHAKDLEDLLSPLNWPAEVIAQAGAHVQRFGLGTEDGAGAQATEDVACLVFLETQYDELLARIGEVKTVTALRKTMAKMSPAALQLAADATPPGPGRELLVSLTT